MTFWNINTCRQPSNVLWFYSFNIVHDLSYSSSNIFYSVSQKKRERVNLCRLTQINIQYKGRRHQETPLKIRNIAQRHKVNSKLRRVTHLLSNNFVKTFFEIRIKYNEHSMIWMKTCENIITVLLFQVVYWIDFQKTWVQWMNSFQRQCWRPFRYKTSRMSLILYNLPCSYVEVELKDLRWHVVELYPSHSSSFVRMKGCMRNN